jgi:hypothetical protein
VIEADCAHPWWVALPKKIFRCNDCGTEVTVSSKRKRVST